MIKISVIVPVYNAGKYITKSIMNLLNQNMKEVEIIAIDDGSVDNSLELLNKLAETDTRLRVFTQKNFGAGYTRNKGIDYARGEYISFIDIDDCINPEIFTISYKLAQKYDVDAVQYGYQLFSNDKKLIRTDKPKEHYKLSGVDLPIHRVCNVDDLKHTLLTHDIAPWKRIYKREFLLNNNIRFDEIRNGGEDIGFSFEVRIAARIFYAEDILYKHYIWQNSLSTENKAPLEIETIIKSCRTRMVKHGCTDELQKYFNDGIIYWSLFMEELESKAGRKFPTSVIKKYLTQDAAEDLEYKVLTNKLKRELIPIIRNELKQEFKITPQKILNQIFSVKNEYSNNVKRKVITLLGLKIKFKISEICTLAEPPKTRTAVRERERERERVISLPVRNYKIYLFVGFAG